MTDCPSSLQAIKTTINGTQSPDMTTAIKNAATDTAASNLGVTIARATAPTAPFTIGSVEDSKRLVWTSGEMNSKEVQLIARLVETKSGPVYHR
ncbi:fimbrial protein [Salmonella enterica subsp. enterica serovar Sanjuan]|uniref:Fimbrial protein n=1 Tax=Salmonella enterica subsp. enterica serovar Sanjuan TaxID=1160765 RepID=A0A3S4EXY4_SALET|nr:fimbrial protein [Salmonella enterica subsp. enterica serovar Sanjuan]